VTLCRPALVGAGLFDRTRHCGSFGGDPGRKIYMSRFRYGEGKDFAAARAGPLLWHPADWAMSRAGLCRDQT